MINFNLWPINDKSPSIFKLEQIYQDKLIKLPNVLNHLRCSLNFVWHLAVNDTREIDLIYREGYLRAALMEFALIENALVIDIENNELLIKFTQFHETDEPLLHLLKLLRNYELHLSPSKINTTKMNFYSGPENDKHYFDSFIFYTNDLITENIKKLKVSKYYTDADLNTMIKWYNHENRELGVHNIVWHGINKACEVIANAYC